MRFAWVLAALVACAPEPEGPVDADDDGFSAADDCDDDDAGVHPGAVEYCDGFDNDCDGVTDPPEASNALAWHPDVDGDGYGDAASEPVTACDPPEGAVEDATDCDDDDGAVRPGALDVPGDDVDTDCDGEVACFVDGDGDGWGTQEFAAEPDGLCSDAGGAAQAGDCDDAEAARNPGAEEIIASGVDEDCDGDELCWQDLDGDGYGGEESTSSDDPTCSASGVSTTNDDCDDLSYTVSPESFEACGNGIDDDCDGYDETC